MMAIKILLFFAGLAAGILTPLDDAMARDLSSSDALSLVLKQSQDIKKAAANVEKMQAVLDGVNSRRLFQADISASYVHSPDISGYNLFWPGDNITQQLQNGGIGSSSTRIPHVGTAGISATQPLYTFGKIGYAVDMARKSVQVAATSKKLAELEMGAAAAQLYWSAKMSDELVKIAQKSLKNTKYARDQLTAAGRANRSNLVKISADVAAREIDLADAEFSRDSAHRMLKAYAGIDDSESLALTSDFPDKFDSRPAAGINPPEWDIYRYQAEIYDAEKRKNYMTWLPSISAFGKYDYQTFSLGGASELMDMYRHSANAGISVSLSLVDWGAARHAATESAMAAIAAREDLDKSKRLKSAEYADLIQKHEHLRGQLKGLGEAKDLAEKAYSLSRDRFFAGQTSATELSDVERSLRQMEIAVLNAKLQILITAANAAKYEAE
ncbi:MAG: TolC family protein [Rickettsiales bacterium]|jgi:outer membrane protein|nr:TolC family protein [Rickettsiales bacterium]